MERQISLRRKGSDLFIGVAPPEISDDEYLVESDSDETRKPSIPFLESLYNSDDEVPLSDLRNHGKGVNQNQTNYITNYDNIIWSDADDLPVASFIKNSNKPNVLPLWTDVAEGLQKQIPSFSSSNQSRGDALGSLDYFKSFFDDDLLEHIVFQSNLYCTQTRPHKSLRLTVTELEQFIGVTLYMSIFDLHRTRNYWSKKVGLVK
nr:unnamed protein product [Callosobruchus analis]